MGYFSPHNAPVGGSHLVAEITAPPGDRKLLAMSDGDLVKRVLMDVKDLCGISPNQVTACQVRRLEHAYVVYDLNYLENRGKVLSYFDSQGIRCLGRFGAFEYINMDQCVQRAKDMAQFMSRK